MLVVGLLDERNQVLIHTRVLETTSHCFKVGLPIHLAIPEVDNHGKEFDLGNPIANCGFRHVDERGKLRDIAIRLCRAGELQLDDICIGTPSERPECIAKES